MCLIPDQELHRYIPTSSDTVPLVVRFSSGCVPLGCFGSCLLSKYRWEVVRGEDGTPKCLAHNIASLHDLQLLVDVFLVDFTQYLQVHVTCDLGIHQLPPNTCSLVLRQSRKSLKSCVWVETRWKSPPLSFAPVQK